MNDAIRAPIVDVLNFSAAVVGPSPRCMDFGAKIIAGDATRFRFWAPALHRVTLEVEGLDPVPMRPLAGGWFEIETLSDAGSRYKFRISKELAVPDPAARAMRGGASVIADPRSYQWRNLSWRGRPWREAVFYELHVGILGGFAGAREKLPRLAALGITAVELMPIASFPGGRNWGYDGVFPYAPSPAYGTPDELKTLVDAAHGLGMMIFLDVVYNHFGPEGNFLDIYAPTFFRQDLENAWGRAIDFQKPEVRRFFTENALYWLEEFRFDGLRFDAVHAITHPDWLDETAAEIRTRLEPHRSVHLVLENDDNVASHMRDGFFNAQWNDDMHHAAHVLLTGETDSYYRAYADRPAEMLARCLAAGFAYQGEPSPNRKGRPRGSSSADLPPSAFVSFLQNHDQIGNRALGERLTTLAHPKALEAAIALQLLCPQIPLIFMGEEVASASPFLFFTDHTKELAQAVREGRKREFEHIAAAGEELPDPNSPATFEHSAPRPDEHLGSAREGLYRRLLFLRRDQIAPRLENARALGARALGPSSVLARWSLGGDFVLAIACNLGADPVDQISAAGSLLFESQRGDFELLRQGTLSGRTTVAYFENRLERAPS
jgi:maltooligosyltrehalose trehalohydrolase